MPKQQFQHRAQNVRVIATLFSAPHSLSGVLETCLVSHIVFSTPVSILAIMFWTLFAPCVHIWSLGSRTSVDSTGSAHHSGDLEWAHVQTLKACCSPENISCTSVLCSMCAEFGSSGRKMQLVSAAAKAEDTGTTCRVVEHVPQRVPEASGRLLERMDSGQALERFMLNSNRTEAFLPTTAGPLPLPGGFSEGIMDDDME